MDPYYLKYLKYKNKYLKSKKELLLKIQQGGANTIDDDIADYGWFIENDYSEDSFNILTQLNTIKKSKNIKELQQNIGHILNDFVAVHYNDKIRELGGSLQDQHPEEFQEYPEEFPDLLAIPPWGEESPQLLTRTSQDQQPSWDVSLHESTDDRQWWDQSTHPEPPASVRLPAARIGVRGPAEEPPSSVRPPAARIGVRGPAEEPPASVRPPAASVRPPAEEPSYTPVRVIDHIQLPLTMPSTQSIFYMPPIAEAYYIAKRMQVPPNILNASGIILKLKNKTTKEQMVSEEQYNQMVQSIVEYLRQGKNLDNLQFQFDNDLHPSKHNSGHIDGPEQEKLLKEAIIPSIKMFGASVDAQFLLEIAIQTHYI